MNSILRAYTDNDYYCCDKKKSCRPSIESSSPNSTIISGDAASGTSFTVNSITVDTSSLNDVCIKLDFTSTIVTNGFSGTIKFQVFKFLNDQFTSVPVGPEWIFSAVDSEIRTFSFFVLDCDFHNTCNKYCTYTVVATRL